MSIFYEIEFAKYILPYPANLYYAKEMRYPKHGGYRAFVQTEADKLDIRYG